MEEKIKKIIENQLSFQKMVGLPIDSIKEHDRNALGERYLFKLIEEAVELRKEFPSTLNAFSKHQKLADISRIKEELSDVMLFMFNFMIVWKLDFSEMVDMLARVQENNFITLKKKMLDSLNSDILSIPGYTCAVGNGNVNPKYIFVVQQPNSDLKHGDKVLSDLHSGSLSTLYSSLADLKIINDCYFTSAVKSVNIHNEPVEVELISFWSKFLEKELNILEFNNTPKIIIFSDENINTPNSQNIYKIPHPINVTLNEITLQEYEEKLKNITLNN
jgi:NTP pyrophosphatase (non-canonical NTP hydrolase)